MAILVKGTDFSTGQQVAAVDLDNLVDAATFATGAVDNATTQLSSGAIIVKDGGITTAKLNDTGLKALSGLTPVADRVPYFTSASASAVTAFTSFGRSLVDDADAAAGRSTLGVDLALASVVSGSGTTGADQTGTSGGDLVFDAAGAPTVTLTAGTWLVIGTVRVISSGAATGIRGVFRNSTDASEFGGSASNYCTTTVSDQLTVVGVTTIASGSKVIYFKLYNSNEAGGTIIAGDSTGSSVPGYITAVRLLS